MKPSTHKTVKDISLETTDQLIVQSLAKLDGLALGVSFGTILGLVIFFATNFLVFKGGEQIGQNLALLGQYFIGYTVTFAGSLIGLFYGFVSGFALGWLTAFLRNFVVSIYLHIIKIKSGVSAVNDYIDNP